MKNYIFIFLLLLSSIVFAQPGYPGGGGGVDRSIAREQYMTKKKKPQKIDYVALSIEKLNEKLSLDSFQEAAIGQLLKEDEQAENKIAEDDSPVEAKYEKIVGMREKLNTQIKELLRPEQVAKYEEMSKKKKKK